MMKYAKAIVGALVVLCSSLAEAYADNGMSTQELFTAIAATLVALSVIWAVPNQPPG